MSEGRFCNTVTFTAAEDLGDRVPVKAGSSAGTVVAAGANEESFGITVENAEEGQGVSVALPGGEVEITLASSVAFLKKLKIANTDGEFNQASATGQNVGAISLEAGAAGDIIKALVAREKY